MNEMACAEDYRPRVVQKAFRRSGPHLARTSPTALTAVLGQQEEQLEFREMLELLGGHRPGTVVVVPRRLSTVNYIKTWMTEDVRGTGKETEMKEILTSGGR